MIRDYQLEMNSAVREFIPVGDYVSAELAELFYDHLQETDPDLLSGWMSACAVTLLAEKFSHHRRSQRARAVRSREVDAFRSAADKVAAGDSDAISVYATHHVINDQNVSRPIGKMTREDCFFVADSYGRKAKKAQMQEAFWKLIGKKIPIGKTIDEVLPEDKYLSLYYKYVSDD